MMVHRQGPKFGVDSCNLAPPFLHCAPSEWPAWKHIDNGHGNASATFCYREEGSEAKRIKSVLNLSCDRGDQNRVESFNLKSLLQDASGNKWQTGDQLD